MRTMADNTGTAIDSKSRPKRNRNDVARALFGFGRPRQNDNLELKDILAILKGYDEESGGINCRVCGKLYKSKVCYTKHLWEHSVYWNTFSGIKNHERVLSIQAALILWHGHQISQNGNDENCDEDSFHSLLVTSPQKKDATNETKSPKTQSKLSIDGNVPFASPQKKGMKAHDIMTCPKTPMKNPKVTPLAVTPKKLNSHKNVGTCQRTPEKQGAQTLLSLHDCYTPLRETQQNSSVGTQRAKRKLMTATGNFELPGSDMCSPAKAMRQC